jgi:hypothetical protein
MNMTYRIVMENPGGELDSRTADSEEQALAVLKQMLDELPLLADGDVFRVIDEDVQ